MALHPECVKGGWADGLESARALLPVPLGMLLVPYRSLGLQLQCWRGWPACSPWSHHSPHRSDVMYECAHPCTFPHMRRHTHTYP